ncbi:calcineurin-like phosphoesterase family protein [Sphaerotilus hippei]|uniref:Calcineurin-like phosphoesterase family protein n=1 Tax=Sphaerotilus hippei TaxID=744406 RepID=A0A318H218_9BURK|nr:metallophosphoesterase family protein [Sphaerotilus hippei]PXW96649.1 calcineurin-like phosphoesterase family protein [Sphaerotilus hippei]
MKLALITDIHANREAFEACLEQAHLHGADRLALLGDFVGYGADPGWVVERVQDLVAQGAIAVRGNHDEAVVKMATSNLVEDARRAVQWTRDALAPGHLAFLGSLPYRNELGSSLFVHANAWAPEGWEYILSRSEAVRSMMATDCRHTFAGHVHQPALYHLSSTGKIADFTPVPGVAVPVPAHRQWLALPGSCGQPRDGNPAACWAMFDDSRHTLTFHRVPYHHEATAAKIMAAGLPRQLAERLHEGT